MADWLTKMQNACPHPIWDEDTTYYDVPLGEPIANPEPLPGDDGIFRIPSLEETMMMRWVPTMMRAWCPRCKKWKEPLLAKDGRSYVSED